MYGLGVRNGAMLYFDELNAAGGINGKKVEVIAYDNKADNAEAVNAFTRLVDEGITVLIGDVLTGNTIAVVGEAYPINMPMVTASATAEAVTYDADSDTVYSNVFRTCFIDPFQGEKMAEFGAEVLGAKTAAIIYETGSDYSIGLKEAFEAKCEELGVEIVATEGYATGDKDFKSQMTNIATKNPDIVFCPNYYEDDGLIVTQARAAGVTAPFLGGDGWNSVASYASAADLEGCYYCSSYAPGTSDAIVAFENAYTEAYGSETLNMFAATAYDAAKVVANALTIAENAGLTAGTDEYKQAVIDAIRDDSTGVVGITSESGYAFDEHNNPIKSAAIMRLTDGVETFDQWF
jgi:branched-chain amino acid transport system substrate-binding protein